MRLVLAFPPLKAASYRIWQWEDDILCWCGGSGDKLLGCMEALFWQLRRQLAATRWDFSSLQIIHRWEGAGSSTDCRYNLGRQVTPLRVGLCGRLLEGFTPNRPHPSLVVLSHPNLSLLLKGKRVLALQLHYRINVTPNTFKRVVSTFYSPII
jgi:hypothetical protein